MIGNFDRCYATTRVYEGGKVNHKDDPGGRTNKGVTQATFTAWLKRIGKPSRDVYTITDEETKAIYHDEYWTPAHCDELPYGLDLIVFDTAINSGVNRAGILLQATLNKFLTSARALVIDGDVGSKTIDAAKSFGYGALPGVIDEYCNRRLAFMQGIRNKQTGKLLWASFGKGWGARVGNVRTVGKSMIAGSGAIKRVVPTTAMLALDTGAKAYSQPGSPTIVSTETAAQATAVSTVGVGVMETLQSAASTFQGLSDVAAFFKYAFIAITVGLAIYSLYAAIQSKRKHAVTMGEATVTPEEDAAATEEGAADVVAI